jgi:nicotinate-nucleotide adenylyltransferase
VLPARAFGRPPRRAVGLLGGSFNPAHAGHRHIAELALRHLGLDEVWWLVSPQNPLKGTTDMAPLGARLASASSQARHPKMRATAVESELGTRYTADTLKALSQRFPRTRFVWIMGADNLRQIARWEAWTSIFHLMPIAVFARPAYDSKALAGKAATRFKQARRTLRSAGRLAWRSPPWWVFVHSRLHPASGTSIRRGGGQPTWTMARQAGLATRR